MLKSFTSYEFLIFVSVDYIEFNVLANSNGLVDFNQFFKHARLYGVTRMYKDSVPFINYFENRKRKYIDELKKLSSLYNPYSVLYEFNI